MSKTLVRFSIPLLLFFLVSIAASPERQTGPEANIAAAHRALQLANYDSALWYFKEADEALKIRKQWNSLSINRTSIAEVYRILNNTPSSLAYLDSVYSICRDHLSNPSEELAKALEIHGRVLDYNLRQFEKAKIYYDSSLALRQSMYGKEHLLISESFYLIGRVYFNQGQFEEAKHFFDQAVEMKIRISGEAEISLFDPYMSLGALNRRLLKMDESLEFYQKAQRVWKANNRSEDHPSYGMLTYGMGNLYIETGMYEDAKGNYQSAVEVFQKFFGEKDFRVATTYSNIGACFSNQLEYTSAVQYYQKSRSIYEEVLPESHPFITSLYVDLGDMYHQFGKLDESARYGGRAIELMEKYQPMEDNRELGVASLYNANTLLDLGQLPLALKRIETSISILRKMDEQYLLSNAYTISGSIYHAMNDDVKADMQFKKAIGLFGDTTTPTLQLGYVLGAYAQFKSEQQSFSEALILFDKSLFHLGIAVTTEGVLSPVHDFQHVDFLIDVLPGRAENLLRLYETNNDEKSLTAALNTYTFLTDVYERIMKESKWERSKLLQVPDLATYYEKAVDCALKLAELNGDPAFKEKAFSFAEQSKAIILWQYVHDSQARQFSKIPPGITLEERRLKERLGFMEKTIEDMTESVGFRETDSANVVLKNDYFRLRTAYDSLVSKLEADYPDYYNLKYKEELTDVSILKSALQREEAILEYLVGEEYVYAFLITDKGLNVFSFNNHPLIDNIAVEMRDGLISNDQQKFSHYAKLFYSSFFKPVDIYLKEHGITSIIVVPDGAISYIPLEALVRDDETEVTSESYLIQDYTFHYQYAAGLISTYKTIAQSNTDDDFIGFAPTFGGNRNMIGDDQLSALDFTSEEVDYIKDLFGGKSFIDDEATELNFKKHADSYSIIHLATHAVMDDQDADRSRLYFSQNDSLEDSRLYAYELFNMHIPASLVTLSACNTGTGRLHKGEGVMSLSRAFAYAGCPSIVTSLWQAQDQSTALLMHYFYENLSDGMKKSVALSKAKIRYLAESDKVRSSPFFWAGFILVGDDAPLNKSGKGWWIGSMLAVLLLALGWIAYRRRLKLAKELR